jgi:hypothetical protein
MTGNTFYPALGVNTNIAAITAPIYALFVNARLGVTGGIATPTSIAEAKNQSIPGDSSSQVQFTNNAAAQATVTIKVVRIWR